jgi:hypothetical protein
MRFLNRTAPVRRTLGGLLALMLVLTNLSGNPAAAGPPEGLPYRNLDVGIVNASFGLSEACLLDGWTVSGNGAVTVAPAPDRLDCMARLTASNHGRAGRDGAVATLEQRFVVQGRQPVLRFFTDLGSDNPRDSFTPQTITLYDESDQIITQEALVTPGPHMFEYSLSAYVSYSVRLSLTVAVNPIRNGGPSTMWMTVDFRMLHTGSVFNSSFKLNEQCSLDGWMTSGDVKLDTNLGNGNCFAVISARQPRRSARGRVSASIDQMFVVNPNSPVLQLYLVPYSDKPDTDFPAQTVTLIDRDRNIIYQKSHNLQAPADDYNFLIDLDLSDYVGQALNLHIDVMIDGAQANSPGAVSMKIDDQWIFDLHGPNAPPGGGW